MKRYLIILLICLLPFLAFAAVDTFDGQTGIDTWDGQTGIDTIDGQMIASAGGGCPSLGTYKFAWDGDHGSGTTYGCEGATPEEGTLVDGTISATYGESGNGLQITAVNDYLRWANTSDDKIDDDVGTIWFSVYMEAITGSTQLLEFHYDSNNYILPYINSSGMILFIHKGGGTYKDATSHTDVISATTWTRIGVTWKIADGGDLAVQVGGNGWNVDNNDGIVTLNPEPPYFQLGELNGGFGFSDNFRIDNISCHATYQYADPTI